MTLEEKYREIAYGIIDEQEWANCEYNLEKYLEFKKKKLNKKTEDNNEN